jgi:hypothetical protein
MKAKLSVIMAETNWDLERTYGALLENGRFASWLQFAPDGIITWKG